MPTRSEVVGREPPESRPVEEKAPTTPLEAVQAYHLKQEASLLVGR